MAALLSHLAPILAPFPALIVTDKSFHCLPSSVADLNAIARTMIHRFTDNIETTREISSSISLSKNVDTGGSSSQNASDSGKGSEPYPTPEPPEIDGSWNSKIAFNIVSDLHDPSKPQGIQTLQLQGKLMIEVYSLSLISSHSSHNLNREPLKPHSPNNLQPAALNSRNFRP